ncbi:MAG: class I SAM-dependent methyltransferase [Bacillota bacterium]|jgi:SAM-dependent methyltransferase
MFLEHDFVVWGTLCDCGRDVAVLQNKVFPWSESDFQIKMICPACGKMVVVDQGRASDYYSRKILAMYDDVRGTVLDLGCGGGFLTEYVAAKKEVTRVLAIDPDPGCAEAINQIPDPEGKIDFRVADASVLGDLAGAGMAGVEAGTPSIDYLIHRDVFMFIDDPEKYFDDVTKIVRRGIRHVGWFMSGNARMKNTLEPQQILSELEKRGWRAQLHILDWYKCGYYISADKQVSTLF